MKTVIIAYDLKNVRSGDNERVKHALLQSPNAQARFRAINELSAFPYWVTLSMPDTTIIAEVDDATTEREIAIAVDGIIQYVGATTKNIYVGEIGRNFLLNK